MKNPEFLATSYIAAWRLIIFIVNFIHAGHFGDGLYVTRHVKYLFIVFYTHF